MTHSLAKHTLTKVVLALSAALIVCGALYSGCFFFATVRALVGHSSLPFSENIVQASSKPLGVNGRQLPDVTVKKERVNILLLGIDQRDHDPGPYRTDTMILVSLDPATDSAAMLSIPRDLWVTIPGFGESRINTAHYLGDAYDYPGGGVALAKKTVWYALGVPVHYYVRVNFAGFEKMVDAIGGLTIEVEDAIHDEEYPDENFGTLVVDIPAGIQHMDGKTALQYARSRHGTGDYDRMARQQAVIMALRDKALSLDIPLSRIPQFVELAGDSLRTDLGLDEIVALADVAKRVRRSHIRSSVIDDSMTTTVVTPDKRMVEVPIWDEVRRAVDDLFPAPVPSVVPAPSLAQAQLTTEGARIVLQNGTLVTGLAQKTADALRAQGFAVVRFENADRFDRAKTLIVVHGDSPYTVSALCSILGVEQDGVVRDGALSTDDDITVILGRDYARKVSGDG